MKFLYNIINTSTFKNSSITLTGSLINGALGMIFFILIARDLGPSAFGLVSVSIAAATLVSDVTDFGINTGLVHFVSKYLKKDMIIVYKILKLSLEIKIIVSILVIVLGVLLAPVIAMNIFHKSQLTLPLQIAFAGVISIQLFSFTTHSLQAFQKFFSWSGILIFTNGLRLLIIYIFIAVGSLAIDQALIVYITMPFLGFLAGTALLPTREYLKIKNELSISGDFFKYNKWVAAFTLVTATSSKLDTFISARLLSEAEVGIYSASNQLVQIVPQLIGAFGLVIAPKMSDMGSQKSLVGYLKKTQLFVVGCALLGLIGIPIAWVFIPLFYGVSYIESFPVFVILLLAMLIFLISVPIHNAILYYFARPRFFFYLAIGHLLIIIAGGWYLISRYGVIGAGITVFLGMVFNLIVPAVWLFNYFNKNEN